MTHHASSKKFSVLICGAGNIAHRFDTPEGDTIVTHVKAFQHHGEFRVEAIVDDHIERAREAAQIWNIPYAGECLHDVRAMPFDVISICTPDHTHAHYLRQALELRPKLVVCEKPLSICVHEASQIVEMYNQAGIRLAVNYSRRWIPIFQELRDMALSGKFGAVVSARMKYYKGFLHNASHFVDIVAMLTQPVLLGGASLKQLEDVLPEDPTLSLAALMSTEIAGGSTFPLMIEGYDSRRMSPLELEIVFETTAIVFQELSGSYLTIARLSENATYPGFYEFSERSTIKLDPSLPMKSAIANIYRALTENQALASTGETALRTLQLCTQMSALPVVHRDHSILACTTVHH
ncbi:MAG: Gfo/Idh/MocA family oxidoreductase [Bacteroidota bacterium]|nr:Gfo/Idh/MocA family oxidoreductase [Candidatus Kapabacteria bacterium]MDW8220807.1 Gfo/Idh/MocA family oxidoreductase [Bacteroidota bacterium]